MSDCDGVLLPSGGFENLKSFQLARLIYDITFRFTELYISAESRTRDQMVQAARSGVQNIAEGSVDAATSTKLELNLYNVARSSLIELRLDYEDFLRQNNVSVWNMDSPLRAEFIARRVNSKSQFKSFVEWAEKSYGESFQNAPVKAVIVANAALLLIDAATFFLKRQIETKGRAFVKNGGFSERMCRKRREQIAQDQNKMPGDSPTGNQR